MTTVRRGYTHQLARRPPRFRGVLATTVQSENTQVLRAEVMNLLEKGAIGIVPPAQSESGFYSRSKKTATYSRSRTPELCPDEKVLQDDHFETDPPANMPRGLVHVAGSERRVLLHPGSPPSQTILEIHIRRGGISIQVPAVWAIPGSLHFYTGFYTPLRQIGICILNYLDYWLILAQSQAVLSSHKTLLLSHLDCLGLSVNFAKSILSPSFVPGHSYRLSADDSKCLSGASHNNSAPRGLLQGRYRPSAQSFPENAGPYGSGFSGTPIRSATYATHPVLAEAEGYIRGLASRTPSRNGDLGLCISPGPLEGPLLAKARRDPRHGAQKESCHDRCFQQGLGSAVRGQTDLRPLVRRGVGPAHQLPRNASSVSGLSILPARHSGTPCASTLRQQVRSVIHK